MTETLPLPRRLTLADLERAVEVQSRAFASDPLWVYLVPDEKQRWKDLRRLFVPTFRLGILSQQAYGVGDPLEGVAVWNLPGEKTPLSAILRAGFWRVLLSPGTIAQFRKAIPIFSQFERMQKQFALDTYYYLSTISVHPDVQGKGVASRLIRPFLAKADAEGIGAYTETMTPENVGLYEHYGYRVMEAYQVPGTDLCIWSFYRAPR
jgi:ribosomal protein S18 acetylase RimI-like enzyme